MPLLPMRGLHLRAKTASTLQPTTSGWRQPVVPPVTQQQ